MIRKSQEKFKDCQGKSGEVMKFYLNFMKVMCKSGILSSMEKSSLVSNRKLCALNMHAKGSFYLLTSY